MSEKPKTSGCPFHNPKGLPQSDLPRVYGETDLSYNSYLKVMELTALQQPQSSPSHHDEMLFITIHQAYELWFKQILHESEKVITHMKKAEILKAHHFMKRSVAIMKLLVDQIHLLETMSPVDFLRFRDHLKPASGFQSFQFREIEFIANNKDEAYLQFFENDPTVYKIMKKRLEGPDLYSTYLEMLVTLGHAKKDDIKSVEGQIKAIMPIYQKPSEFFPLYLLSDALVEFDEYLALWRTHHVLVVERVIGFKSGTGGSSGVEYLKTTTSKKCFPVLWEVRSHLK